MSLLLLLAVFTVALGLLLAPLGLPWWVMVPVAVAWAWLAARAAYGPPRGSSQGRDSSGSHGSS